MRFLPKTKKSIVLTLVAVTIGMGTSSILYVSYLKNSGQGQDFKVVAKNFAPGTKISYNIFSEGEFVGNGNQSVDEKGEISLEVPKNEKGTIAPKLTYDIEVEKSKIDEMMDVTNPLKLVVGIDRSSRSVTFDGSGFDEFSDVFVSSGDKTKITKSDWAGKINETVQSGPVKDLAMSQANQMVKLAFQNFDVASDVDKLNPNGSIEVFFGDSNGSSTAAVQQRYSYSLMMMTEQLSAVMMQQVFIIGTLLDAKSQLETQRKLHELYARAHKDYHPSDQMCRFGTFVRSIANTESNSENNKRVLNRFLIDQYLGVENSAASYGVSISTKARVNNFVQNHCDPNDNNGGLRLLCDRAPGTITTAMMERYNKDIDFTRTLDNKLTVDIDFSDNTLTGDENDILTMAQNLYFPQPFGETTAKAVAYDTRGHYQTRSFAAKMGVAHNSFINIVGMKSSAPVGRATAAPPPAPPLQITNTRGPIPPATNYTEDAGWTYMKAMMREFGIQDRNASGSTDDEIHALLGNRPSYYAQMEVLTKKIYQNPDFFTNLYDKPANVERIGAAMDAIMIMNQRDRYDSLIRRELLTSMLVEEGLSPHVEDVNARMFAAMQQVQQSTR